MQSPEGLNAGESESEAGDSETLAPSAPAEPGGPKLIRVIEVHRYVVDPLTAGPEELDQAIAVTVEALEGAGASPEGAAGGKGPRQKSRPTSAKSWPGLRETLRALAFLARDAQGELGPIWAPFDGRAAPAGAPEPLESVSVREALASPAVRAVVASRGAASEATERDSRVGVRARPARRVRAIGLDGSDQALAAEEPALIIGLAVDPRAAGRMVVDSLGSCSNLGLEAAAASGAAPCSVLAALGPVRPPEYEVREAPEFGKEPPAPESHARGGPPASRRREAAGDEEGVIPRPFAAQVMAALGERGFRAVALGGPDPGAPARALLLQARAALAFYASGAAAATALARVAAAARGLPGAPPDLLAALGPETAALAEALAADGRAIGSVDELPEDREVNAPPPRGDRAWWTPAELERVRYVVGRLARTEPVVAAAPEAWAFDLAAVADLYRVGALGALLAVLVEGRESPQLDALLELSAIRLAKAVRARARTLREARAASLARQYLAIVVDKLGAGRAHEVLAGLRRRQIAGVRARGAPGGSLAPAAEAPPVDDYEAVLALLPARERELVLTEYEGRRQAWAAASANRCPHVRLVRRVRGAPSSAEALAALRELEPYLVPELPPKLESSPGGGRPAPSPERGRAPERDAHWLLCRSCGFRAICPHVRERVRLEARRTPFEEMRTRLFRFAVRVAVGTDGDAFAYYCRLCAELIADASEEDRTAEELGRYGNLDAGLRTRLWVAALRAAPLVRWPMPTDERQFAATAAEVLYPLLMAAEGAILRGGRRRRAPAGAGDGAEEEALDPRTELYVLIFVFAYVLGLIADSQGRKGAEVGFDGVRPGARLSAYGERLLQQVVAEGRSLLAQIADVTAAFVKERFAEAFRLVRGAGVGLARADPEEELAAQTLTVDPVYRYGAAAARVAGALPLAPADGPAAARKEFELVLGMSLPALVALARASARDPALAPLFLRRVGVTVPSGGSLEELYKDPRVNLHAKLYDPPADPAGAAALAALGRAGRAEAAGGGPGRHGRAGPGPPPSRAPAPSHAPAGRPAKGLGERLRGPAGGTRAPRPLADAEAALYRAAYRLLAAYSRKSPSAPWFEELAGLRRSEAGLRHERRCTTVPGYWDFRHQKSRQFAPEAVSLALLYDEEGLQHRWQTYLYDTPDGPLELAGGPAAARKGRTDGTLPQAAALVDVKCAVCGVLRSQAASLDEARIRASLRALAAIGDLFVFYSDRCPEGDLHEYSLAGGRMRCSRCGIDSVLLRQVLKLGLAEAGPATPAAPGAEAEGAKAAAGTTARAYYEKYAALFGKERRAARRSVEAGPLERDAALAAADAAADGAAAAWKGDYELFAQVAGLGGVPPAVVEAIGAQWGLEYEQVAEGRDLPPPPAATDDPRLFEADAAVRAFLADYSMLRHAARIVRLPAHLAELLVPVPRAEYAELPRVLPDFGAGYVAGFAAMLRVRPAPDVLAFAVQSLCRVVLAIAGLEAGGPAAPPWVRPLAATYAKQALRALLKSQRLLCRNGSFNFSIFWQTSDEADVGSDVGDVGEDVLNELLIKEDGAEEAADNPFSGENMDMDTSSDNPNLEPS